MDDDASSFELGMAFAINARIGVPNRIVDFGHSSRNDRISAWWRTPVMCARFQRDIHRSALQRFAGGLDGDEFRMRFSRLAMVAFTNYTPIFDDYGADHRVWAGASLSLARKAKRSLHIHKIYLIRSIHRNKRLAHRKWLRGRREQEHRIGGTIR